MDQFSIDEDTRFVRRTTSKKPDHLLMKLGIAKSLKQANILSFIIVVVCVSVSIWLLSGLFGSEYAGLPNNDLEDEISI